MWPAVNSYANYFSFRSLNDLTDFLNSVLISKSLFLSSVYVV